MSRLICCVLAGLFVFPPAAWSYPRPPMRLQPAIQTQDSVRADSIQTAAPQTLDMGDPMTALSNSPAFLRKFTLPQAGTVQDCFYQGVIDGRRIAVRVRSSNEDRTAGAVGSTMALGLVGGVVSYASAASSRNMPPDFALEAINGLSVNYQQGFIQGYEEQARSMNKENAATGIAVGLGLLAAIVLGFSMYAQHQGH